MPESTITYAEDVFDTIESKQDDCPPKGQNAEGYGNKIQMPYLVRLNGKDRWHRVYCAIWSNVGSLYIIVRRKRYFFRHDQNLRLTGVWPK